METAGVDAGPIAPYPATASVEGVAKIDRFCASASIRDMVAMAYGIEVCDRFACRLIRAGL